MMGNICAYVSDSAFGVITDGYAHNSERKDDLVQKLFRVGGNIVFGSGASSYILFGVKKLSESHASAGPKKMAEDMAALAKGFNMSKDESFRIYFAGVEWGGPKLYLFDSRTGGSQEVKGYALDGSGAEFVKNALQRDKDRGFEPTIYGELDEIVDFLYDSSREAPRSLHANSYLQFGLINGAGNKIVCHPEINLTIPPSEYASKNGNGGIDRKKKEINDAFYKTLVALYGARYLLKIEYNAVTHLAWNSMDTGQMPSPDDIRKRFSRAREESMRALENYLKVNYGFLSDAAADVTREDAARMIPVVIRNRQQAAVLTRMLR